MSLHAIYTASTIHAAVNNNMYCDSLCSLQPEENYLGGRSSLVSPTSPLKQTVNFENLRINNACLHPQTDAAELHEIPTSTQSLISCCTGLLPRARVSKLFFLAKCH